MSEAVAPSHRVLTPWLMMFCRLIMFLAGCASPAIIRLPGKDLADQPAGHFRLQSIVGAPCGPATRWRRSKPCAAFGQWLYYLQYTTILRIWQSNCNAETP